MLTGLLGPDTVSKSAVMVAEWLIVGRAADGLFQQAPKEASLRLVVRVDKMKVWLLSDGDSLCGCDKRQLTRSVTRKLSGSKPPSSSHERSQCAILKAARRFSAEADIAVDARERPGLVESCRPILPDRKVASAGRGRVPVLKQSA